MEIALRVSKIDKFPISILIMFLLSTRKIIVQKEENMVGTMMVWVNKSNLYLMKKKENLELIIIHLSVCRLPRMSIISLLLLDTLLNIRNLSMSLFLGL